MPADRSWLWLAALCYLAAFVWGLISLLRRRGHTDARTYALIAAGFFAQTIGLYLRGLKTGGCPLGNPFEIVQFITWSCLVVYLFVGPAFRLSLLGFFTAGFVAGQTTVSLLIPAWDAARRSTFLSGDPWVEAHAALAVFSYGVYGLLALVSAMYLLQSFSLKRRRFGGVFTFLPSLVDLEKMHLRLLGLGVSLLALSLALGAVYWSREHSSVPLTKLLTTLAVGAAYLAVLVLRGRGLLVARTLAWTCLALFLAAMATLRFVDDSRPPAYEVPLEKIR